MATGDTGFSFPSTMLVQQQGSNAPKATGYTGIVSMDGMNVPVLNGFANYKGKEFGVNQDGSIVTDEKNQIVARIVDGQVQQHTPESMQAALNGQTQQAKPQQTQSVQNQVLSSLSGGKDPLSTSLNNLLTSLKPATPSAADAVPSAMKPVTDMVSQAGGIKSGIQAAKNNFKADLIKSLLGI